jgi:ribosome maturation factor RimP
MPTLDEALQALLEGTEMQVLNSSVTGEGQSSQWSLVVDTPAGVTIGEITGLARRIRKDETVAALLHSAEVRVEVASPGTGYGLREPWQYPRNIGRTLKVTLADNPSDDAVGQTVSGKLAGIAGTGLSIETAEGTRELAWQEIDHAVVVIDWQRKGIS